MPLLHQFPELHNEYHQNSKNKCIKFKSHKNIDKLYLSKKKKCKTEISEDHENHFYLYFYWRKRSFLFVQLKERGKA